MSWFDASEASDNRVEAQQTLMWAARNEVPGSQVIGYLQRSDKWYDSRQFGEDWAHWRDAFEKGSRMAYVNRDSRPGSALYADSRGLRASKYQTIMEIRGRDLETGDDFTRDVTIVHSHDVDGVEVYDSSQMYTRAELEDLAQGWLDWYGLGESIEVSSIVPIMGFVNPDM